MTFPFIISFPLPLPFVRCLPLPFRFPILCSLRFPGFFLTALCDLLTVAAVIVISITRTAPTTVWRSAICPVLIIIMLDDYPITIQWSNAQEVGWFVLLAPWWLNHCPEIIATVQRDMLGGALIIPWASCLQIGSIELIPEGTGVLPPPIVHMVVGCVKHLPHIYAEGSPPLPERRTPAPGLWPHWLEFWKVGSHDWIKKDYIIKEDPCPLILDDANYAYPDVSMDVFRDESHYTVSIQWQSSIHNRCWHFCPSSFLPISFAAALYCHRCELQMNLHPTH